MNNFIIFFLDKRFEGLFLTGRYQKGNSKKRAYFWKLSCINFNRKFWFIVVLLLLVIHCLWCWNFAIRFNAYFSLSLAFCLASLFSCKNIGAYNLKSWDIENLILPEYYMCILQQQQHIRPRKTKLCPPSLPLSRVAVEQKKQNKQILHFYFLKKNSRANCAKRWNCFRNSATIGLLSSLIKWQVV